MTCVNNFLYSSVHKYRLIPIGGALRCLEAAPSIMWFWNLIYRTNKVRKISKFQTKRHDLTKKVKNRFKCWIDEKTDTVDEGFHGMFQFLGKKSKFFAYLDMYKVPRVHGSHLCWLTLINITFLCRLSIFSRFCFGDFNGKLLQKHKLRRLFTNLGLKFRVTRSGRKSKITKTAFLLSIWRYLAQRIDF